MFAHETNAAAKRLYEWHGFSIAERKPSVANWSGDNLHHDRHPLERVVCRYGSISRFRRPTW